MREEGVEEPMNHGRGLELPIECLSLAYYVHIIGSGLYKRAEGLGTVLNDVLGQQLAINQSYSWPGAQTTPKSAAKSNS